MYEDITYELLLARMIRRVEGWARERHIGIDTREGSLIRTALAPVAVELKLIYIELDEILNEAFADTASRRFLIKRCAERGIVPRDATHATRRGEFNIDVGTGARFSLNLFNYTTIKKLDDGVYELECETPGAAGTRESGDLIPIDYIDGLEYARLTDVLIPGEDEEGTEHLRQRYFDSLDSQAFGGNVADYREKVGRLPGVGGVKVYPVWDGGGTVKVVFTDNEFSSPSAGLVDAVQTEIDPIQNHGEGKGIAPIGHTVTIAPVDSVSVDIGAKITYQAGWEWEAVKPYIEGVVDQYLKELAESWDKVDWLHDEEATLVVRISQIEARLLGVTGVLDIQVTTLNGMAQNLTLGADEIPVRGDVTADEIEVITWIPTRSAA